MLHHKPNLGVRLGVCRGVPGSLWPGVMILDLVKNRYVMHKLVGTKLIYIKKNKYMRCNKENTIIIQTYHSSGKENLNDSVKKFESANKNLNDSLYFSLYSIHYKSHNAIFGECLFIGLALRKKIVFLACNSSMVKNSKQS